MQETQFTNSNYEKKISNKESQYISIEVPPSSAVKWNEAIGASLICPHFGHIA